MISPQTRDLILETARIEEVVGDVVVLKKRGSNLIGLCPFHNERTPSFTVSPSKGFFKCFGCGKAGDSVTFLMEHDHLTFPEALKQLAQRYQIEVEEKVPDAKQIEEQNQRESIFSVNAFASRWYADRLWNTESGKAIGWKYFSERGFSDDTIREFQLGFAPPGRTELITAANSEGYKDEFLDRAGLTVVNESNRYDRFRERVIFPVHNLSGRVIAFGARILKADPKAPKYLNSPETEVYQKGKTLYGIFQAKKAIISNDECYLVEGYTDVISMHQAGVSNVVASSGTALTGDQIRLIGRYTRNITVLYDGDTAGIKASLRGIDMILSEGMHVRVVLFPDGEDPDSYSRRVNASDFKAYLKSSAVDFISFKASLLMNEAAGDPIRKASLIHEIVESIAHIPDAITRSAFIKQAAVRMEMAEEILVSELNKKVRKAQKIVEPPVSEQQPKVQDPLVEIVQVDEFETTNLEIEILKLILNHANDLVRIPTAEKGGFDEVRVIDFLIWHLKEEDIHFSNPEYSAIMALLSAFPDAEMEFIQKEFLSNLPENLKAICIGLITSPYTLSDWSKKGVHVQQLNHDLLKSVLSPIYYLKFKQLSKIKNRNQMAIRDGERDGSDIQLLLKREKEILSRLQFISNQTGTVVYR